MTRHSGLQALALVDSQPDAQRQAFFDAIFDTQSALIITDVKGTILKVNRAFTEMCGYAASDLIGQTPQLLRSGRHDSMFYRNMFHQLKQSGQWSGEIWDRHKSGRLFLKWSRITAIKDDEGHITHYVASYIDITAQQQARDEIYKLAFYDQLTSLPNRSMLLNIAERRQLQALLHGKWGALALLDLDNFKLLNDRYGYDAGDRYLGDIAAALQAAMPADHVLARLDGDQFVILFPASHDDPEHSDQHAVSLLDQLAQLLKSAISINGEEQRMTACSGVSLYGRKQQTPAELLHQAELALLQAKQEGRGAICHYRPDMETSANRRAFLLQALDTAQEQRQFHVHLQPQVDSQGLLIGAEALIRWQHPQAGAISPDEFISLAEAGGHIIELGGWMLNEACQLLSDWQAYPAAKNLTLSVNVSALQFTHPAFVQQVIQAVHRYRIQPRQLKLELTESLLAENSQDIAEKMKVLKSWGIGLALDDFGTGYSSLLYLRNMSFDQLKIDRAFVNDLPDCINASTIARTIATLGHSLGMSLVAEGVENSQQIHFLEELGCTVFQGYFYSRPLPIAEFEARYLKSGKCRQAC